MKTVELQIPFCGFYESILSQEIDSQESNWIEWQNESESSYYQGNLPDELQVDIGHELYMSADYSAAYERIARAYVAAFDEFMGETFELRARLKRKIWRYDSTPPRIDVEFYRGESAGLRFSVMTSPKYYNFETDRLFVTIPYGNLVKLWRLSVADKHKTLREVIKERHTSRDGYWSHYSNEWEDWKEKPLESWDNNELMTLLLACFQIKGVEIDSFELYDAIESEVFYDAWQNCVDWQEFDKRIRDSRQEKLESWIDDDREAATQWIAANMDMARELLGADSDIIAEIEDSRPYRCPYTLDMFAQ